MRRQFTTRERIGVITESGFSAEGLKLSGSPRAMRALEEFVSVLCDMVLGQREQITRVRELHHSKLDRHPQGDVQRCIACLDLWPCPTVKALDGEL